MRVHRARGGRHRGGRTLEPINADNGGPGGAESMKTDIDYTRRIVAIKDSDVMSPGNPVWVITNPTGSMWRIIDGEWSQRDIPE